MDFVRTITYNHIFGYYYYYYYYYHYYYIYDLCYIQSFINFHDGTVNYILLHALVITCPVDLISFSYGCHFHSFDLSPIVSEVLIHFPRGNISKL